MKKIMIMLLSCCTMAGIQAQTAVKDTAVNGNITVIKDARLNLLEKKEAAFNEALALAPKVGKGYRLIILSTTDRELAMRVRTQLIQRYPDEKIYMSFQPPYIKLRFGNYVEKPDAEDMRKDILKNKIVTGNIYIVPENIEVKPEKVKEPEE